MNLSLTLLEIQIHSYLMVWCTLGPSESEYSSVFDFLIEMARFSENYLEIFQNFYFVNNNKKPTFLVEVEGISLNSSELIEGKSPAFLFLFIFPIFSSFIFSFMWLKKLLCFRLFDRGTTVPNSLMASLRRRLCSDGGVCSRKLSKRIPAYGIFSLVKYKIDVLLEINWLPECSAACGNRRI